MRNPKIRGDEIITFKVQIPNKLNERQKEMLRQFAAEGGDNMKKEGFFDKMKKKLNE